MRRERRLQTRSYKFFYVVGALIIFLAIILVVLYKVYSNKLNDISKSMLSTEEIIGLVPNSTEDETQEIQSASSEISKTIEEAKKDEENKEKEKNNQTVATDIEETTVEVEEQKETPKRELVFAYPIEGEKTREFSMENLIYSETLEEWTTHQGLDIKADRTTVVKAAETGTVVAIKNDPRYGLTVIIEHENGFKTVYSNLLTTEFVTEDEKVEKGQSIGTVGNSAVFEIADEPHLHFEMIKDGEYVDPTVYLK